MKEEQKEKIKEKMTPTKKQRGWAAIIVGIAIPIAALSFAIHSWTPMYLAGVAGNSATAIAYGAKKVRY